MNLVSLRLMAVGLGVIAFVACGSSGKVGNNSSSGGSDFQNNDAAASGATSGNSGSGNTSGSVSGDNSMPINTPPPTPEAGSCPSTCVQDTDCAPCGVPADGGVYCCGAGECYGNPASVCDDEAGASGDDGSTAAPAPSM